MKFVHLKTQCFLQLSLWTTQHRQKISLVIVYFFNHCFVMCLSDEGLAAMAETEGVIVQSDVIPSPPSFAQVSGNVYSLDARSPRKGTNYNIHEAAIYYILLSTALV